MLTHRTTYQNYLLNCRGGVPAEVVLGSPRFRDCRNFGICRMNLVLEKTDCACKNCLSIKLRLDPPTGRLLLHFSSQTISPITRHHFFSRDTFRIDDPFQLPTPIINALSLPPGDYYIKRGHYPLLEDEHYLTVSLRLEPLREVAVVSAMRAGPTLTAPIN